MNLVSIRLQASQHLLALGLALALLPVTPAEWAEAQPQDRQGPPHQMAPFAAQPDVDLLSGAPQLDGIRLVMLAHRRDERVRLELSPPLTAGTPQWRLRRGEPLSVRLSGLQANTAYRYTLRGADDRLLAQGVWQTGRPAGSAFRFTLTADSHLDQNTDSSMYQRTLALAREDQPDFHLDLGDTFMVDKHASREAAAAQYLAQHHYLAQLGRPIFLVLGNHDGEEARLRRGVDSLADWANGQRRRLFANPAPGGLYSGDLATAADGQALQDYYAWTWGDALFVVLNPYWHAPARRQDERWGLSLGEAQYRWLQSTLAASQARYKLIFVHQLVGGIDRQGRGGIEGARFGEWGGDNADGSSGLATQRPGWAEPVHALLVRHGVSAVFHGHDHLYASQRLDGVAYIEVPQPGHRGPGHTQAGADYGYRAGTVRGEGGYLRLDVNAERLLARFIGTDGPEPRVLHETLLEPRR